MVKKAPSLFQQLTVREKILLCLYAAGSMVEAVVDEAADPLNLGYYRRGYTSEAAEFLRTRERTVRQALYQLKINNLIRRAKTRQGERYRLTAGGLERIFERFPKLKYGDKVWDGYWRVVVYDIPEKTKKFRNRLRYELKHLGFKFIQNSVWVTPLPVEVELEAFLKKEGLWGRILVLKSVLPEKESRRWAAVFRAKVSFPKGQSTIANAVEHYLAEPHLPQGFN